MFFTEIWLQIYKISFIREILYFLTSLQSIVRKSQNAYDFSFMKLIVSTFLVYKVKKCLLISDTSHALQAVPRGPRDGELVNKRRATVAHVMVNECPNR